MATFYHFNGETTELEPAPRAYVVVRGEPGAYQVVARVGSFAVCRVLYRTLANADTEGVPFAYFPADEWDNRNRRKCELCGEVWEGEGGDCDTCKPIMALAMAKGKAGNYSRPIFDIPHRNPTGPAEARI